MEPMYKDALAGPAPKAKAQPAPPPEPGFMEKTASQVRDRSAAAYQSASDYVQGGGASSKRQVRYAASFVAEIRKRLDVYFKLTIKNVRDVVPQAIGHYLVSSVCENMQFELLSELNKAEAQQKLLGEPPHIMEERRALTQQLEVLKKAIMC